MLRHLVSLFDEVTHELHEFSSQCTWLPAW